MNGIGGLHHVTTIAGDPQQNVDFYIRVLGMRLVKQTVNYDDPGTYHLYFADETGQPGTVLTFFPWLGAPRGRRGTGQITTTSFSVPEGALDFWMERFNRYGIEHQRPFTRFDDEVLVFYDSDGLQLEMVVHPEEDPRTPWEGGNIPPEFAIRGFYGVTLSEEGYERTAALLTNTLGLKLVDELGSRFRYRIGEGGPASVVDVLCIPNAQPGIVSVGSVHHMAFRTPSDEEQRLWRQMIVDVGLNVTPVINRNYFHSIYFREPGGILFEIATDPPGFLIDEPLDKLGTHFTLPPWLEPMRDQIQAKLPTLHVPQLSRAA